MGKGTCGNEEFELANATSIRVSEIQEPLQPFMVAQISFTIHIEKSTCSAQRSVFFVSPFFDLFSLLTRWRSMPPKSMFRPRKRSSHISWIRSMISHHMTRTPLIVQKINSKRDMLPRHRTTSIHYPIQPLNLKFSPPSSGYA